MKKNQLHPIVDNINKIVKDSGLDKSSFAFKCGFPESKWNKISNGVQELKLSELSKIAEVLEMSILEIVTYPKKYVEVDPSLEEKRVSVTFEVSSKMSEHLLKLVLKDRGDNLFK